MKETLDWLNIHIGLEGTVFFAFIVIVTSIVIKYFIKTFKDVFIKKDGWGERAGELKDKMNSIQKEYRDFENSLSWKQKKLPENKNRLTSLKDRLIFAKKKRDEHFSTGKNKKNRLLLPLLLLTISVVAFVYIQNYTNIFQKYLAIINFNLH